jgi:Ca2+-binding RTX toxin-like protein
MLENLTLTGKADTEGTGNDEANALVGNGGDNVFSGLAGNDTLNGGTHTDRLFGGAGNDTLEGGMGKDIMEGGDGDDLYVVDNVRDIARERASASGGIDTVQSSVSHTLRQYVENLTLTGSADADGTSNGADNAIVGNSGRNVLSGLGGNDVLSGGARTDRLLGGDGNDTLDGGLGKDILAGGDGDDVLNGGAGDNVLKGGAGSDTFLFDTSLVAGDLTIIADMAAGADRIALAWSVFSQAGPVGPLVSAAFHTGSAAHDASDRIIYDAATGGLMYDADGTGAQAASIFATVSPGLALSADDFLIV